MRPSARIARPAGVGAFTALAVCVCGLALGIATPAGAPERIDPAPPTEYEIKALFLLNFTRYVDWPPEAFAAADAPVVIGIAGDHPVGDALIAAAANAAPGPRPTAVVRVHTVEASDACHTLFIGESEEARLGAMLDRVRTRPVLTVGETDLFARQGGIITFVRRAGRVRLEVDLDAARLAGLQISSRLLQVADTVKGRPR